MRKILIGLSLVGVLACMTPVSAALVNAGKNVTVNSPTAMNENLYVAGGNVEVSAPVNGDLIAAGGTLFLGGAVSRDILAAGGRVTITGPSAEDVRVAGGDVTIGGAYSGEIMAAGGQITVTQGARVAKDSYIAGGTITFNGSEAGTLHLAGKTVYMNGTIQRNLIVRGGQITIGPHAVINGNFNYFAPKEAAVEDGARIAGTTTFHQTPGLAKGPGFLVAFFALGWFVKFLIMLTAAYLLWYVLRHKTVLIVQRATSGFGRELLRGFAVFVLLPVAAIISFITVFGALAGVAGLLVYALLLAISAPIAGIVTASLLLKRRTDLRWYHILLGMAVFDLVILIPFLGWLAGFLVYLASLGSLAMVLWIRVLTREGAET